MEWVKQRRWNRGSIHKPQPPCNDSNQRTAERNSIQVCKRKLKFVMKRTGHRDVRSLQKYQNSEF